MMQAPVMPNGCPRARSSPFTCSLSQSISRGTERPLSPGPSDTAQVPDGQVAPGASFPIGSIRSDPFMNEPSERLRPSRGPVPRS
ncbi:MAG: hypothetical protein QOI86_2914 [Actinomycetota bacterium]|jgi:hypothetical protein|nr:hypothetical protein [Actinomycetota bacterium]